MTKIPNIPPLPTQTPLVLQPKKKPEEQKGTLGQRIFTKQNLATAAYVAGATATTALFVWGVSKLYTTPEKPPEQNSESPPSFTKVFQLIFADWKFAKALFTPRFMGAPNPEKVQQKGAELLKGYGLALGQLANYPLNAEKDSQYMTEWAEQRQECPLIEDYLAYQKENGYFNKLAPSSLKVLYGDKPDLSLKETRAYYDMIDKSIATAAKLFQTDECLDAALASTEIRASARQASRLRMEDQEWTPVLRYRDELVEGPIDLESPQHHYWVGKYGSADKTQTCEKLIGAAQRTNEQVNARFNVEKNAAG